MKTNQTLRYTIGLVTLLVAGLIAESAQAQAVTATFTNTFGDAIWERDAHIANLGNPNDVSTAGNWSTGAYPDNHRKIQDPNTGNFIPGTDPLYDVVISLPIICTLGNNVGVTIQTLNISSVSTLNIAGGSLVAIANGTLTNNGLIRVNSTDPVNSISNLRFDATSQVLGTGSILLNGIGYNRANFNLASNKVTIGSTQTLHGKGTVLGDGSEHLINNGTIAGDDATGSMQLDLGSYTTPSEPIANQNNGTIKAIGGGVLGLYSGTVDQTGGGTFLADGANSIVQLGGGDVNHVSTVIGGILNTANGGLIVANGGGVYLTGVTNNGAFYVPPGITAVINGTGLTNNATVTVNNGTANTTKVRFDASGTLGGTGALLLKGVGTNFNVATLDFTNATVTNGVNHLIHGLGTVGGDGSEHLINNGTIAGDDATGSMQLDLGSYTTPSEPIANQNNGTIKAIGGGVLGLYSGTVDQTGGGTFLADGANSVVQLGGGDVNHVSTVIGGILTTANNGLIVANGGGVFLTSVTNNGTVQIPGGGIIVVTGTGLTNNGTILVDTAADNLTTKIRFDADGTLDGNGSVTLNGIINAFNVADFDCNGHAVINGTNHTIKGNGNILINGGTLTNNGTIAPGLSPGHLDVSGNFQLGSTSNLSFEIGGTTQVTQYDLLSKSDGGTLTLNGNLTVRLINGFIPANGDNFSIVTTQTILAGAFSNVANGARLNTADGGGSFKVTYTVVNNALLSRNVTLSDFQPAVTALPNLQVTNIITTNKKDKPLGKRITITATISNTGSAAAGASHTSFKDGVNTIGSVATPAIPAGSSVDVSIDWKPTTYQKKSNGSHTLTVAADANGEVAESNETDNTAQKTVTTKGDKVLGE